MKKNIIISIIGSILIISSVTYFIYFNDASNNDDNKPRQRHGRIDITPIVEVYKIKKDSIVNNINLTGEITAKNIVTISSKIEGVIDYCPWREGDLIENKGETIVRIDSLNYRIQIEKEKSSLDVAKSKYQEIQDSVNPEEIKQIQISIKQNENEIDYYKKDMDNIAKLVRLGGATKDDYEKVKLLWLTKKSEYENNVQKLRLLENLPRQSSLYVQKSLIRQAEVNLNSAKKNLSECLIQSPISGVVSKVFLKPGDLARSGSAILEIVDMSSLVIQFSVPEYLISFIHIGTNVLFSIDALPSKTFTSRILRKHPLIDPQTRNMTVEASLNTSSEFYPGMFVRINLILNSKKDILSIPIDSIKLTPKNEKYVFVVKDNIVTQKFIKTGIQNDIYIEIVEGLSVDDLLVIKGYDQIKNGMKVNTINEQSKNKS